MYRSLLLLPWTLLSIAAATRTALPTLLVPNPTLTPGNVLNSDPAVICAPRYTSTVRKVPVAVKNLMFRIYGIRSQVNGAYELDHDMGVNLGGSNNVRNLWPESDTTQPLNAHVKDILETTLHPLACRGTISMQ